MFPSAWAAVFLTLDFLESDRPCCAAVVAYPTRLMGKWCLIDIEGITYIHSHLLCYVDSVP